MYKLKCYITIENINLAEKRYDEASNTGNLLLKISSLEAIDEFIVQPFLFPFSDRPFDK
ncbi:MAG: hypothetical protein WBM44_28610 [Waterburya sp.]